MQPILNAIERNPRVTVATIAIVLLLITFSLFASGEPEQPTIQELEQKVIAEKARLDTERDKQIESITTQIESLKQCIVEVKKEKQTLSPITDCTNRTVVTSAVDAQGTVSASSGSLSSSEAPQP